MLLGKSIVIPSNPGPRPGNSITANWSKHIRHSLVGPVYDMFLGWGLSCSWDFPLTRSTGIRKPSGLLVDSMNLVTPCFRLRRVYEFSVWSSLTAMQPPPSADFSASEAWATARCGAGSWRRCSRHSPPPRTSSGPPGAAKAKLLASADSTRAESRSRRKIRRASHWKPLGILTSRVYVMRPWLPASTRNFSFVLVFKGAYMADLSKWRESEGKRSSSV